MQPGNTWVISITERRTSKTASRLSASAKTLRREIIMPEHNSIMVPSRTGENEDWVTVCNSNTLQERVKDQARTEILRKVDIASLGQNSVLLKATRSVWLLLPRRIVFQFPQSSAVSNPAGLHPKILFGATRHRNTYRSLASFVHTCILGG